MSVNEDELERRAVEELLKEAKRGKVRSETMGPAGWIKCPLRSTNKRFLLNTLRPCAAERTAGNQSAPTRRPENSREERDRGSRHRPEDREHGYRKESRHRGEHSHCQSSVSGLASSPRHTNRSNRSRSRSPIRERLPNKRSTDRTRK